MHLLLVAPFFSFAKYSLHILTYSLLAMPAVHLRENWRIHLGTRPAGGPCRPRIEEDEIGTGALQTLWPVMRHQVRVKESKELKVVEEKS